MKVRKSIWAEERLGEGLTWGKALSGWLVTEGPALQHRVGQQQMTRSLLTQGEEHGHHPHSTEEFGRF